MRASTVVGADTGGTFSDLVDDEGRITKVLSTPDAPDEAVRTGIERLGGGQWQLVISEIPYMVPKGKLIEQVAQAIADKKLPILADVRIAEAGSKMALQALEAGAVEIIAKPKAGTPQFLLEARTRICDAVRAAAA